MLSKASFLNKLLVPAQARAMSTASIKSRFEEAYAERTAAIAAGAKKT